MSDVLMATLKQKTKRHRNQVPYEIFGRKKKLLERFMTGISNVTVERSKLMEEDYMSLQDYMIYRYQKIRI